MKKLLALFLAAVLTLSLMIVPTVAATDVSGMDKLPAYDANTTLDKSEYIITDADGMSALAAWVAAGETFAQKTVYLAADGIETTVSIGDSTNAFAGTFDGNGNSLKITITGQGLFAYASGATIQNLTIADGSTVSSTKGQLAAVVGTANNNITLINVINYADIPSSVYATGGLVGIVNSGDLTVTNCANHGAINGSDSVGGIVGRPNTTGTITITDTVNTGVITGNQDTAGFVGLNNGASKDLILTRCVNTGDITMSNDKAWTGGLVGRTLHGLKMTDCANHGTITGTKEVGGLVGTVQDATNDDDYIVNCVNTGKVVFDNTDTSSWGQMAAGILARANGTAGIRVENCVNYGHIYSSYGEHKGAGAGIVGTTQGKGENADDGSGTANLTTRIINCTNYGVIDARDNNSFPNLVAGWNSNCKPTVTNTTDKSSYTTQMVGYQIAAVSDSNAKADLRIIASIDSADHTNVGFNVVVKDANGNKVAEVTNYSCTTIYSNLSVLDDNDAISASAYRSNGDAADGYLFAIVIQDIDVEDITGTYYFEVTTFVDGSTENCDTASFGVAQPASGN